MTATPRPHRPRRAQPARPAQLVQAAGHLAGPVVAVQPWPSLLVQAAWWADPATRRVPLAVVATGGTILAASIGALEHGVVVGQTLAQGRLCYPTLVAVPPERAVAAELWHHALTVLLTLSPLVEDATHNRTDEAIAYLDGRGLDRLWGDTSAVAQRALQALSGCGLAARVGAGPSRAVASALARRMDAAGPRVLSAQESRAFLAALPLADPLFALDPLTLDDLHSLGLRTAGHLAALSHDDVATRCGPAVSAAWTIAHGVPEPPLRPWTPPARITVQRPLDGAVADRTIVDAVLTPLCQELDARLRAAGRATELLTLHLICEDAPPTLRCLHPTAPLAGAGALTLAARVLWARMQPQSLVETLALTAARLCPAAPYQETLFGPDGAAATHDRAAARAARLAQVLQAHRAQFGPGRIRHPHCDPHTPHGWTWSEDAQEP